MRRCQCVAPSFCCWPSSRRGVIMAARPSAISTRPATWPNNLGRNDNRLWTAFGPANVAIHELSVQVALGDARRAFQLSETLDTDGLPAVLRGRRSQVHFELAWAA